MSKKKNLLNLIFVFTFIASAHGKNHALILGGGGEPAGNSTIFDVNLNTLADYYPNNDWSYQVSFNGGHKNTESIIQTKFHSPESVNSTFTQSNYNKLIDDSINKIKTGQLKNGDQLMIVINSHGAKKKDEDKTHKIAFKSNASISNYENLSGLEVMNLDRLQEVVNAAEANGVKLAIVDSTCFSGATQNLAKMNLKNTCIITSTGPDHYSHSGTNTFTNNFFEGLKSNNFNNLEDLFLDSRKKSVYAHYPMISSPAGKKVSKSLYNYIAPYIQYDDQIGDELSNRIDDLFNPGAICKDSNDYKKLISKLNALIHMTGDADNNLKELKNNLEVYRNVQIGMYKNHKLLKINELSKNVSVSSTTLNPRTKKPYYSENYTVRELLKMDKLIFKIQLENNFDSVDKYAPDSAQRKKALDEFIEQTFSKIDSYKNRFPDIDKLQKQLQEKNKLLINNTFDIANSIAEKERGLYDLLYKDERSNNPCTNFKI